MANQYYVHGIVPAVGAPGASSAVRAEFDAIQAAFDKLVSFAGNANKLVVINSQETGWALSPGALSLGGAFSSDSALQFSGAFPTTIVVPASVTITLPSTSDTLVTLSGVATLSNKTVVSPVVNGTITGNALWRAATMGVVYGGTGLSSYTVGDLIYASGVTPADINFTNVKALLHCNGTNGSTVVPDSSLSNH